MAEPVSQRRLRHEKFLAEYAKDLNCEQAMRRAGYAASYARGSGGKLMRQPHIARRVAELRQRFLARQERTISKSHVLDELSKVAFADVRQLYGEDGRLQEINALDDQVAAAVASVKEGKNGSWREVRFRVHLLDHRRAVRHVPVERPDP
jgi:hypothetical protein